MASTGTVDETNSTPITLEAVQTLIAELVTEAPTSDVKKCLKAYEYGKDIRQLKAVFNQFSKAVLVSTLDYLNVPDQSKYVKATNVENIICRIQNLLPDICSMCNEVYSTKNGQCMLLNCAICGQEVHKECLQKLLASSTTEDAASDNINTLNKDDLLAIINPFKIPGFVYICQPCTANNIPNPEAGLKKGSKKSTNDTSKSNPSENPLVPVSTVSTSSVDRTKEEGGKNEESIKKPICKFFLHKKCKFGIKGEKCKYTHPTLCKKLLKFGHSEKGCKMGNKCEFFHPKMCNQSLNKRECKFENCRFYHVSGTKRVDSKNIPGLHHPYRELQESSQYHVQDAFLGPQSQALQNLRMEILEAMDMRLAIVMSKMQNQHPYQRQPPLPQGTINAALSNVSQWGANRNVNPDYPDQQNCYMMDSTKNGQQWTPGYVGQTNPNVPQMQQLCSQEAVQGYTYVNQKGSQI